MKLKKQFLIGGKKLLSKISKKSLLFFVFFIWIMNIILISLFLFKISIIETKIENIEVKINENTQELAEVKEDFIDYVALTHSSIKSKYAKEIATNVLLQSEKTNLPSWLILAVIDTESEFKIKANSKKGAQYGRGLMQVSEIALTDFNWKTGKNYAIEDLYTIDKNIEVGCWALLQNKKYTIISDYTELYVAYNVGCGDFKKYKKYYLNHRSPYGGDYNALKRFNKYYNKYKEIFKC